MFSHWYLGVYYYLRWWFDRVYCRSTIILFGNIHRDQGCIEEVSGWVWNWCLFLLMKSRWVPPGMRMLGLFIERWVCKWSMCRIKKFLMLSFEFKKLSLPKRWWLKFGINICGSDRDIINGREYKRLKGIMAGNGRM